MERVQWRNQDGVAVLEMCNGANAMDLGFAREMDGVLDEILDHSEITALVLTSSPGKNFSQGVDLQWMGDRYTKGDIQSIKDFVYGMNHVFKRLLLLPIPAVAAINGHAFGNGAILACACDFRFMGKDHGFFCFPEVDVSVPFLPGMIAFVRKAVPEYLFNEMLLSGKRMTAEELEVHNVVVRASDSCETCVSDAIAFAAGFQKKRGIFGELKQRKHKEIIQVMETQDPAYIDAFNLMVIE